VSLTQLGPTPKFTVAGKFAVAPPGPGIFVPVHAPTPVGPQVFVPIAPVNPPLAAVGGRYPPLAGNAPGVVGNVPVGNPPLAAVGANVLAAPPAVVSGILKSLKRSSSDFGLSFLPKSKPAGGPAGGSPVPEPAGPYCP